LRIIMIARVLAMMAVVSVGPLAAQQQAAPARSSGDTSHSTTVITPAADQARGVDAEVRAALFDLVAGRPLAALNRLEWLEASPVASTTPRSRTDIEFLLAESYYQLGMSDAFRARAATLDSLPGGERYTGILVPQLMLDAYRRGDYVRVRELSAYGPATGTGDRLLGALVSGLAAYQSGDFTGARTKFAEVRAAGGIYAPYAQYMEAMSVLQGDTTRAAAALTALQPLAEIATGAFGDQVRLTAAELAYESGQYDAAVSYARGVGAASGLAAPALLAKAWAFYRGGALDSAKAAFTEYATRYPLLSERDEARLMAGQAMLESGQAAEAGTYLQTVADSVGSDVTKLEARNATALSQAARTLVGARMAGLVFLDAPGGGKTLALSDAAGANAPTVLAAFNGGPAPLVTDGPRVVSLADLEARADTVTPALGADFPRRLLFSGVAVPANAAAYTTRAQALLGADVAVALAEARLAEQLDAHAAKITALEELQHLITSSNAELATDAKLLTAMQDSLDRMKVIIDRSRQRVRKALAMQVDGARQMAAENRAMADSIQTSLGAVAGPADRNVLRTEAQTAAIYGQIADEIGQALDSAIGRHPVFALRDSLGQGLARARTLHDEAQSVLATDDRLAAGELAVLRGRESDRTRTLRGSLAAAQTERAAAEGQLVSLLDAELRARAASVLASLQHDREVAEYGSASAAFFHAVESDRGSSGAPATTTGQAREGSAKPIAPAGPTDTSAGSRP
jgi:outer membrane protein assembly factor BamD (BamD/ComL family)